MEVMQILHMNKGNGETSYAKNSTVQSNIIYLGRTIMDESLKKLMTMTINDNKTNIDQLDKISIGIADLGCSSGPNSLLSVSNIVDTIHTLCPELGCPVPELRICLNDLPNNDFNYIFASLPEFYEKLNNKKEGSGICGPCFVSAVPGSFYGRLFPRRSLHFVHSSSSLHWLSQVPCGDVDKDGVMNPTLDNKGKLYISKTSPESVYKAYALQFRNDFSSFLKSRSEELVPGGRMVLSFLGRNSSDPATEESCYQWELLAQALMSLANEGKIEEEKIDSLNAPYYAASSEEIKDVIEKDGSFSIDRFEINGIDWEGGIVCDESYELIRTKPEALASGLRVANTVRAVVEPMLIPKFGENVMDELFLRYAKIVGDYFYENLPQYSSVMISLIRTD